MDELADNPTFRVREVVIGQLMNFPMNGCEAAFGPLKFILEVFLIGG